MVEFLDRRHQTAEFQVKLEDLLDLPSLDLVDLHSTAAADDVVSEDRPAPEPLAFLPRGLHLITGPLADDLAFKLGEGKQDVQRQTPHAARGAELLRDRDERHVVGVERAHDLGKVQQRPRQSVHLVDHDAIDLADLNVVHQPPTGRRPHRFALLRSSASDRLGPCSLLVCRAGGALFPPSLCTGAKFEVFSLHSQPTTGAGSG